MSEPTNRLTEEISVGFYLFIALLSAAIYVGVQVSSGPTMGGSFLVIGAFWLCVCTVAATALVVLLVNVNRSVQDTNTDKTAVLLATLILISLGGALYLVFVGNRLQIAMAVGVIGLILAPLGLFATIFEPRLRHWYANRTS